MIVKKAYQIPQGRVDATIFDLPCITMAFKSLMGEVIYNFSPDDDINVNAKATDWLVLDDKGEWYLMHDYKYRAMMGRKKEYQEWKEGER